MQTAIRVSFSQALQMARVHDVGFIGPTLGHEYHFTMPDGRTFTGYGKTMIAARRKLECDCRAQATYMGIEFSADEWAAMDRGYTSAERRAISGKLFGIYPQAISSEHAAKIDALNGFAPRDPRAPFDDMADAEYAKGNTGMGDHYRHCADMRDPYPL
jgi:hypothetical protein